jgi:hypothetical protein
MWQLKLQCRPREELQTGHIDEEEDYVWTSSNDLVVIVLAKPSGDPLKYGAVQWNPFNTGNPNNRPPNE